MSQELVDPAYEYIDKKIKLINKKLHQLRVAHNATTSEQSKALLRLSQLVAALEVNSASTDLVAIITRQLPSKAASMREQILTEAASCKAKITTSNEPILLCGEFKDKWQKTLHDLGADFLIY